RSVREHVDRMRDRVEPRLHPPAPERRTHAKLIRHQRGAYRAPQLVSSELFDNGGLPTRSWTTVAAILRSRCRPTVASARPSRPSLVGPSISGLAFQHPEAHSVGSAGVSQRAEGCAGPNLAIPSPCPSSPTKGR